MRPRERFLVLLVSWALAASAAASPLGRLFFTPEQRAALDGQRHADASRHDVGSATMRLDGIVARRGGGATVWINGRPQRDRVADADNLRVGESIDLLTREKRDVVAPGTLRIGHGQAGTRP